jgi:hypothetical protein
MLLRVSRDANHLLLSRLRAPSRRLQAAAAVAAAAAAKLAAGRESSAVAAAQRDAALHAASRAQSAAASNGRRSEALAFHAAETRRAEAAFLAATVYEDGLRELRDAVQPYAAEARRAAQDGARAARGAPSVAEQHGLSLLSRSQRAPAGSALATTLRARVGQAAAGGPSEEPPL